jgi:hypothetical protein
MICGKILQGGELRFRCGATPAQLFLKFPLALVIDANRTGELGQPVETR